MVASEDGFDGYSSETRFHPSNWSFWKEENNSLINFSFVWYVVLYFILKAEDTLAPTTLK